MKPSPFREVKRKLEAAGFVEIAQTGSTLSLQKPRTPAREQRPHQGTGKLRLVRCGVFASSRDKLRRLRNLVIHDHSLLRFTFLFLPLLSLQCPTANSTIDGNTI